MLKKVITAAICLTLFTGLFGVTSQANAYGSWHFTPGSNMGGYMFDDYFSFPSFFRPNNDACQKETCSVRDAPVGHGFISYPTCSPEHVLFCVEGLSVKDSGGILRDLKFVDSQLDTTINLELPQGNFLGGTPSIWSYSDSQGQQQYFAVSAYSGFHWANGVTSVDKLEAGVARVDRIQQRSNDCLVISATSCYMQMDFEPESVMTLTIKVPDTLGGFYMGRLLDANISQSPPSSDRTRLLTISGKAEIVPRLGVIAPLGTVLPDGTTVTGVGSIPDFDGGWQNVNKPQVDYAKKVSNDAAMGVNSAWRIYLMNPQQTSYSRCVNPVPQLLGWGTTNSMFYDFNPPSFANSEVNFPVSGTHYMADGHTLAKGRYEVTLNADFVRCMNDLGSLPISATVSVIDTDSQEVVSTQTVKESNGILSLAAEGFTFSNKTVKVILPTQQPASEPLPTASPSLTAQPTQSPDAAATITPTPPKKITITCVRGKTIKKVTGFLPKCPGGYRTKA
jgi:hypothetical protein